MPDAGTPNGGSSPSNHPPDTTRCFAFGGLAGDVFVTGDWKGQGTALAGVYRSGFWVLDLQLPTDQSLHLPGLAFGFGGVPGDVPVTGTWPGTVVTAPTITTTSLAGGFQGSLYSQQLSATGGNQPYIWSMAPGSSLPIGLNLSSTGLLIGNVAGGTYSFSVRVTDSTGGSSSQPFSLSIGYVAVPEVINLTGLEGQSIPFNFPITSMAGWFGGNVILSSVCDTPALVMPRSVSFQAKSDANQTKLVQMTLTNRYSGGRCSINAISGGVSVYSLVIFQASSIPPEDFIPYANGPQNLITVVPGSATPVIVPVTLTAINGFNNPVTFQIQGPAGFNLTNGVQAPPLAGLGLTASATAAGTVVNILATSTSSLGRPLSHTFSIYVNLGNPNPQYTLTTAVNPPGAGSVNPPGSSIYYSGQSVSISAVPASGYAFAGFSGCGLSGTVPVQTCIVNASQVVTANFAALPTLTVTPGPPNRNSNLVGSATYLLNVNAPAGTTTQLSLQQSQLPSGTTYSFSNASVVGSGTSVLTVRNSSATSRFTFQPSASNGTATSSPALSLTPSLSSTSIPAAMIDPWDTIPTCSPVFVWDSGVGVTSYQLLVGSSLYGTQFFGANRSGVTPNQYATVTLPPDGQTVYVSLGSEIDGEFQFTNYQYPGCIVPPISDIPFPPVAAYLVTAPVATVRNDNVDVQYGYILKPDGTDVNFIGVGSQCSVSGPGAAGVTAYVSGHFLNGGGIWVTFTANSTVTSGTIYRVSCPWLDPHLGPWPFPLADGLTITDPTPVITSITATPNPVATGQATTLTITGTNFGPQPSDQNAPNALVFCPDPGNPCNPSSQVSFTYGPNWWTDSAITVNPQSSNAGVFDAQVIRGTRGSGTGFYPLQSAGRSNSQLAFQVVGLVPPSSFCLQSLSFSAGNGGLASMYVDSTNWQQDSISSNGTTLIQGDRWASGTCGATSTYSYPLTYTYKSQVTMYDVLINLGAAYVGSAVIHIDSDQPSLMNFQDTPVNFNGNAIYNLGGSPSSPAIISTVQLPSFVTNQTVNLTWSITFSGRQPITFKTTHTILVIPGVPRVWSGATFTQAQNITAARLFYVVKEVIGQDSVQSVAYGVASAVAAFFGRNGSGVNILDPQFNAVGHNPWALIGQPSIAASGMDCISQTYLTLVQALQIGVNANASEAFATTSYDTTIRVTSESGWILNFFGIAGPEYPFEGFLYICGTQADDCTSQSTDIAWGLTVFNLTAPFGPYPTGNWPQSKTFSSAYFAMAFNALYQTLANALHFGKGPHSGQEWWIDSNLNLVQQAFLPVPLQ